MQRFIDWTQARFADESLKCTSYTECAKKSLEELDKLERLSPPSGPPSTGGSGGGGAGGVPAPPRVLLYTDDQLGTLAKVIILTFDADGDGGLNAAEAERALGALGLIGQGVVAGVRRDYGSDDGPGGARWGGCTS